MRGGFTLIELSIVVVIIGLIVAGFVGGQTLVKTAKLRKIISDIQGFRVAVNTFKIQYTELPGDITNAKSYWPSCTDSGSNTCNGDGDKKIEGGPFLIVADDPPFEDLRFWQHLSLSNILPGNYTGLYIPGKRHSPGLTVPPPPNFTKNTTYRVFYNESSWGYGRVGNWFMIAGQEEDYGVAANSVMNAVDAKHIDLKSDDGEPDTGKTLVGRGYNNSGSGCVSTYWEAGANWNTPMDTNITCRLIFSF